jgi:methylated-DNA-[protein]-cysteine S-methyltransferase
MHRFPLIVPFPPGRDADAMGWYVRTTLGDLRIEATAQGVVAARFLDADESVAIASLRGEALPAGPQRSYPWLERFLAALRGYFAGDAVSFADVPVVLSGQTDFCRKVLTACQRIPHGQTISYGALAARVGSPGAARGVGTAMRKNPIALIIPCHRVVSSDGGIGGYSAPGGLEVKRRLLEMEGTARW